MPKKIPLVISAIGLLVFIIAVTWYQIALLTPASKTSQTIEFEIKEGAATRVIANDLRSKGIIKSTTVFLFYIKSRNLSLQAGFYTIDPSKNIPAIADIIGRGKVSERKVTIPEGWRNEQIAQLLASRGIVNYEDFMASAAGKQGRLFPDSYRVALKTTAPDIVLKMEKNFDRRIKEAGLSKISDADLILASIVEREAKKDEDRPKMAGVYQNRLNINMALEADPGTQYSVDTSNISQLSPDKIVNYEFWKPITSTQNKTFESPYNMYRHRGLPPTPIANPGIKSIKAAIEPEKHNFFFFFNLNDGTTIYSKTRDEHDANRRKYDV